MAWRIDESLIRGELDNRTRGRVTGRLWFLGRVEPVVLELSGNAWRDIAGHVLRFSNPHPRLAEREAAITALQNGVTGDMTASRRVKVPDCTTAEMRDFLKARLPFPWHWGNSLYLEWFSETNGRVVIESASYQLELDGEPAWAMDPAGEDCQRSANGQALATFLQQLADSSAAAPAVDDDAPTSQVEAKADAHAERMDLLLDRVTIRMTREGLAPMELVRVMEEERKRLRRERCEPEPGPLSPEERAMQTRWMETMNAAAQEVLSESAAMDLSKAAEMDGALWAATDWHPLVVRCHALAHRLVEEPEARGWLTDAEGGEHPLRELVDGILSADTRLAGALGSKQEMAEWPPVQALAGSVLVRLKKAREHLRDALAGLDAADAQNLAEPAWRGEMRAEAGQILSEVERLIGEVRASLEQGEGTK